MLPYGKRCYASHKRCCDLRRKRNFFIGRPLFYVKNIRQPPPPSLNKTPPRHLFMPKGYLVPYRFTLLSNCWIHRSSLAHVLVPYRFTLLSNFRGYIWLRIYVLVPYRFTLLSNYTLLGLCRIRVLVPYRFTLLSNYDKDMAFKDFVLVPYRSTLLSNADL